MARTSSSSPSTPLTTKAATASRGIKARREEWTKGLPPLWVPQADFRHPRGTLKISKTNAKKDFKLTDREIGILPYERVISDIGYPMQLYSKLRVVVLARRKLVALEGSSSQPPLKIAEYTSPSNAVIPDPVPITWIPSKLSRPVSVKDACRLYCIEPRDIQDLSAHSPLIDLATVAKRAVTLHGGFYAHKELVRQHREAEEQALSLPIEQVHERKSLFRFSPMTQRDWNGDYEKLRLYRGSNEPTPPNRVAVFYPIVEVCVDKYGCEWEWLPYWGDF
ncbi:hypothetical protein MSAN_01062100 [Mycena sanguinolenta]|uniref:Uncharacterized protein n=1 Tax=Mycena sanguinolenta TaxID=230812 RepID=A0A8H6YRW2_9AGAR|nr:hypothetical protein MSAN_01062100 [Mycena sanguinolenta]